MGFQPTTRSQRAVGSNSICDSDFFRVYVSPRIYIISRKILFSLFSPFIIMLTVIDDINKES